MILSSRARHLSSSGLGDLRRGRNPASLVLDPRSLCSLVLLCASQGSMEAHLPYTLIYYFPKLLEAVRTWSITDMILHSDPIVASMRSHLRATVYVDRTPE